MSSMHQGPSGRFDRLQGRGGPPPPVLRSLRRARREVPLDEAARAAILERAETLASQALRVLGAAYRPLAPGEDPAAEDLERGLTFLGFVGMMDPPRTEVRGLISACAESG